MQLSIYLNGIAELVSLPDVCLRVNQLMEDPRSSSSDLGDVIAHDPGMTARILKLVNSSFFGFSHQIDSVNHAISILGREELRTLILGTCAVEAFNGLPESVNMDEFWQHSVFTALAARIIAQRTSIKDRQRIFVCGLLHDIGRLIIYHRSPQLANELEEKYPLNQRMQYLGECEELGFSHAEVGAGLMKLWKLPENIFRPVLYHHKLQSSASFQLDAAILQIADGIAHHIATESTAEEDLPDTVTAEALTLVDLNQENIDEISLEVKLHAFEVLEIIRPGITSII